MRAGWSLASVAPISLGIFLHRLGIPDSKNGLAVTISCIPLLGELALQDNLSLVNDFLPPSSGNSALSASQHSSNLNSSWEFIPLLQHRSLYDEELLNTSWLRT